MMRRIILWIIAKSSIPRNAAVALAGLLLSAGVIQPDGVEPVTAGILVIIVGLLNFLVEAKKQVHVENVQKALNEVGVPVKVDGYLGPVTQRELLETIKTRHTV